MIRTSHFRKIKVKMDHYMSDKETLKMKKNMYIVI